MGYFSEEAIDIYSKKYKSGLFGKQHSMKLFIYPSRVEGDAFELYEEKWSNETFPFKISYEELKSVYVGEIEKETNIILESKTNSVVRNGIKRYILVGIENPQKLVQIIERAREEYIDKLNRKKRLEMEEQEKQKKMEIQREESASGFYKKCYDYHIKKNTPAFQIFADKNKCIILYIDDNKGLNFLKIDGYAEEENRGIIAYDSIHYYEKAGNIHYTTDIHGNYSSLAGSITGGNFSKIATVGGGLLFGLMGMAAGAALTYKPMEQKPAETSFSINSDIKTIDDRNVILNFYSDSKQQYIDIELPYDVYNFLSTYLPEKKYGIVDEIEKRTAVQQFSQTIKRGDLLNVPASRSMPKEIEVQNENNDSFEQRIKKLKMMKESGLLTEEEFDIKRKELIDMI